MDVRQSDLKLWQKCPLMFKFSKIDQLPREQSGSLTYGSILHHCAEHLEVYRDLDATIALFQELWIDPSQLEPRLAVDYYVKGTSWKKFMESGPKVLSDWWKIISWDSALVLAREYQFTVSIGADGNRLTGTIDKLEIAYRAEIGQFVVKIVDFKSDRKVPTYGYLEEDLQFSAYAYATTRPEFWAKLGGQAAYEKYRDLPRYGEWIQLTGPKRMDAGIREQRHYNRVAMAVDAIASSVAMGIYVPTISGESCRYCEFRKPCGLPELDDQGKPLLPVGP